MKKIIIFAAALAAMTACNKSVLETATPSEGFGYINLGISADAEMVVTKAERTPTEDELASYTVTLKQGESRRWTKKYSAITSDDWTVPAGTYTVEVENLTVAEAYDNTSNNNSKGQLRLAGSSPVTVVAGKTATCAVRCTVANAKVTFTTDASFNIAFESPTVSVSQTIGETARTVDMGTPGSAHDAENITAAYFEAGQNAATWTLTATLKGETESKTYSKDITLTAGKWSQVTFSTTNTNGTISLTVKVDETMTTVEVPESIDPLKGTTTQTSSAE